MRAHPREDPAQHAPVEGVDADVAAEHGLRAVGVARDEGVEGLAQHRLRGGAHLRELRVRRHRRGEGDLRHALAEVDRLVADALEVGDELQRRRDEAEVVGDGLAEREHVDGELVDLHLVAVDARVEGFDLWDAPEVAVEKRRHREVDRPLAARAHREQVAAELPELVFEVAGEVSAGGGHRVSRSAR